MEKLRNDLLENSKKLIYGTERNLKLLKNERLKKIYLASNCREEIRRDISIYGKNVEVVNLNTTNNETGVVCKKPFSISIIGLTK